MHNKNVYPVAYSYKRKFGWAYIKNVWADNLPFLAQSFAIAPKHHLLIVLWHMEKTLASTATVKIFNRSFGFFCDFHLDISSSLILNFPFENETDTLYLAKSLRVTIPNTWNKNKTECIFIILKIYSKSC